MITKERLEELIEQGATIWNDDWEEIKLDKNTCEICELKYLNGEHLGWCLQFQYDYKDEHHRTEVDLEDLEEDVEKARWELEMTATRTETLKLPTYEDVFKQDRCLDCYTKEFAIVKTDIVIGICLFGVDFTNKVVEVSVGADKMFTGKLTKENYIEACKLCLRLFKGE